MSEPFPNHKKPPTSFGTIYIIFRVVEATQRDYYLLLEQELHRATKYDINAAFLPHHASPNSTLISCTLVRMIPPSLCGLTLIILFFSSSGCGLRTRCNYYHDLDPPAELCQLMKKVSRIFKMQTIKQ